MFGYQSVEMKKFKANTSELDLHQLRNREIVGLFMIGQISISELKEALDLSDHETNELIEGLSFQLSRNIVRDDDDLQVDVWMPSSHE